MFSWLYTASEYCTPSSTDSTAVTTLVISINLSYELGRAHEHLALVAQIAISSALFGTVLGLPGLFITIVIAALLRKDKAIIRWMSDARHS